MLRHSRWCLCELPKETLIKNMKGKEINIWRK